MDIKTAAVILAILCLVGIALTVYVLRIQVPLLKVQDTPEIMLVKYVLFSITVFATIGLAILLAVDIATIGFGLRRSSDTINPVGVIVTFLLPLVLDAVLGALALMYGVIKKNNAAAARLVAAAKVKFNRDDSQN